MEKNIKNLLITAATKYDEKEMKRAMKNPRANYNIYALGHYLSRIDDIEKDVDAGADLCAAITAGFTGSLRNAILKGAGYAKNDTDSGGWVYSPVKAKI